jgi:hypothetical protein
MIAVHAKRVLIGTQSRIPGSIWMGLFALALLGMAGVGYHASLSGTQRSPIMPALVLAFASVFLLIEDLNRGSEGFLGVSQKPMLEVQRTMHPAKPLLGTAGVPGCNGFAVGRTEEKANESDKKLTGTQGHLLLPPRHTPCPECQSPPIVSASGDGASDLTTSET